jgi:hypothetical protein
MKRQLIVKGLIDTSSPKDVQSFHRLQKAKHALATTLRGKRLSTRIQVLNHAFEDLDEEAEVDVC